MALVQILNAGLKCASRGSLEMQHTKNDDESGNISESEVTRDGHKIEQVAAIACVIDDGITEN